MLYQIKENLMDNEIQSCTLKQKWNSKKLDMIYKYNIHHEFLVSLCPVYDYVPQ